MPPLSGKPVWVSLIGVLSFLGITLLASHSIAQEDDLTRAPTPWNAVLETAYLENHASPVASRTRRAGKSVSRKTAVAPSPRIKTFLPVVDHPDIQKNHKAIADEILRMVPAECRKNLKNFYVRYDHPPQRGLAGKSSIVLSGNVPDGEFRALLIHELFGHVVDLGCMTGTFASGPSGFRDGAEVIYVDDPSVSFYRISWVSERVRKADSDLQDFVTGYSTADVFEDFAESVAFYVLQKETFRARAEKHPILAAKYQWIEKNLFPRGITVAEGSYVWDDSVPWDATKLPYAWKGKTTVAQGK